MATQKFWIYDEDKRTFRQVLATRLDFEHPHTPPGRARFFVTKKRWKYVAYGTTIDQVLVTVNQYVNEEIRLLEQKIQTVKQRLVKHPEAL